MTGVPKYEPVLLKAAGSIVNTSQHLSVRARLKVNDRKLVPADIQRVCVSSFGERECG